MKTFTVARMPPEHINEKGIVYLGRQSVTPTVGPD
jgi:hypothetical protein